MEQIISLLLTPVYIVFMFHPLILSFCLLLITVGTLEENRKNPIFGNTYFIYATLLISIIVVLEALYSWSDSFIEKGYVSNYPIEMLVYTFLYVLPLSVTMAISCGCLLSKKTSTTVQKIFYFIGFCAGIALAVFWGYFLISDFFLNYKYI